MGCAARGGSQRESRSTPQVRVSPRDATFPWNGVAVRQCKYLERTGSPMRKYCAQDTGLVYVPAQLSGHLAFPAQANQ
jgi:hypothetical protein